MRLPFGSRDDAVLDALADRLTSLDRVCLTGLESGLTAMAAGDYTVAAEPHTTPIEAEAHDPRVAAHVEVFNTMLARAQRAIEGYDAIRRDLRDALGDQSSLGALTDRLRSLDENCLTHLQAGLSDLAAGELTTEVVPVTTPITSADGVPIGSLATRFNGMLEKAQASIEGYDAARRQMRDALGDRSCLAPLTERLQSLDGNCLTDLRVGLGAVAGGDLTHAVTPVTTPLAASGGGYLGALGEIFNGMLEKAQASIEGYEMMRVTTAEMIGEMSETSATLSASAGQMATAAEESGRAVGEIAGTIESVARGSSDQAGSAQAVSSAAEVAAEVVEALGRKSQAVGDIVATIGGIASQTNLLALNAAIEAARAGEQGRGFAVVAEEVRKLAEGSQESASSISEIIEDIQAQTARAVEAMAAVQQDVSAVASVAEENAAAAEQVSASTEETSAASEEVAATAEEVARAAESLTAMVARFTV
jgi:methyl-accepting chemotaxis protein